MIDAFDLDPTGTCQRCGKRPATVWWNKAGSMLEVAHGVVEQRCEVCCLEESIPNLEKYAAQLPKARAELATLLAKESPKPRSSFMGKRYFTLTEEHVKLFAHAYTSWDPAEFGAPELDPKRPFGNSSVAHNVYEILGWPYPSEEEDSDFFGNDERARKIVRELETALAVVLRTGAFVPGVYEADGYNSNWTWSLERNPKP
ncbi:hypothetical protein Rctr197k_222 [Virus Rctr197k]|nr:hypothetical protein Rctr197k_222 [Virus Rctr197k]